MWPALFKKKTSKQKTNNTNQIFFKARRLTFQLSRIFKSECIYFSLIQRYTRNPARANICSKDRSFWTVSSSWGFIQPERDHLPVFFNLMLCQCSLKGKVQSLKLEIQRNICNSFLKVSHKGMGTSTGQRGWCICCVGNWDSFPTCFSILGRTSDLRLFCIWLHGGVQRL